MFSSALASMLLLTSVEYSQILQNSPGIDTSYAAALALEVKKASKVYNIPSQVMLSIAMLESSYKLDAVNARSNDFGLFQINKYNINAYKFDVMRLQNDLSYSVDAGFKVFAWFYKRYPLNDAIKRYNCGTALKCVSWGSSINYLRLVNRYY